jgi:hypothetical protein
MSRAWIAPAGTPLNADGWIEIGHIVDDGLVFFDDIPRDLPPIQWPAGAAFLLTAPRSQLTWWRWLLATGRPGPDASRVKAEYRRRRR